MSDLCLRPARELIRLLRTQRLSARDVMAAHLDRINRINPSINAIVSRLTDEDCLKLAEGADARLASGEEVGPLHGLPIAFKDTEPAVGFVCSQGSPIFRDALPAADSILVERLRRAGAIPIGKTNVPEFAMGSHTYNQVYGTTRNPYDLTKSAGGSTGGGPRRSPQDCCRLPMAVTWAVRCATRRASTTSSACVRASVWCRLVRTPCRTGLGSRARWRARSRMSVRCSASSLVPILAIRRPIHRTRLHWPLAGAS